MRERSVRIIDSLPELGGQLMALYPEKYIFDVGGLPKVLARDLGEALIAQARQFQPEVILNEEVQSLEHHEDSILLTGRNGGYRTRTLIIAGGKGAFEPVKLKCQGYDEFLGRGLAHSVTNPEDYRDQRVLVVGGGDSAVDWALELKDVASELLLIHRRDSFRAHERSVALLNRASNAGELTIRSFHEVKEIRGTEGGVDEVVIFDNRNETETVVRADAVLAFFGFKPDLGPIKNWGLILEKQRVVVNRLMETNLPGVYAAGDLAGYEGKLDLIVTGFSEAAVAVNQAVKLVDPGARSKPAHSTNLKIFRES
jgi:thioredoxin reductase (NADPH)